jgi:hypothetical protein
MTRLLHAGLVAGARQLGAVVIMTALLLQFAFPVNVTQTTQSIGDSREAFWSSATPFLVWAYLLVAGGFALTIGKASDVTAIHIRHATHLIHSIKPDHALRALIVQLGLAAVLFAVFALGAPPWVFVEVIHYFGYAYTAPIIWAAALSVGVACFGAMACAALKALESERLPR